MTKETIFIPLDYFLIRSPLLPIDVFYEKISKINNLDDLLILYKSFPIIQEGILVANPKLYNLIEEISNANERSKNQILITLFRYLIRLTSRATPFGLFASIGIGRFDNLTHIEIPLITALKRHLRPDMTWVFQMIKKIEKNFQIIRQLKIKAHNALVVSGERVFHHGSYDFENKSYKVTSIKNSPVIIFILGHAKEWQTYENLENLLLQKFDYLDEKPLKDLLKQMYFKQFLICELHPDLLTASPTNQFLDKLCDLQLITQFERQNLFSLVDSYNAGESNQIYKIRESLVNLLENDTLNDQNFIQVDCSFSNTKQILNKNISHEAAKVADFLYKWSSHKPKKGAIDIYHEQFLEKFGSEKAVLFLELIDEHLGLGIPNFKEESRDFPISFWEKNILNKCQQAVFHGEKEVVITEEELDRYSLSNNPSHTPPVSAAIMCELLAKNYSSIDKGEFNLILSSGQIQSGATNFIGRFTHILPATYDKILTTHMKEAELEEGCLFVELSWLPHQGKLGNVAIHDSFRDFSLKIPLESSDDQTNIMLGDLYVGANLDYLFLFSRKHHKRIIFSSNNVLNSELAPPLVHLLHLISQSSSKQIHGFFIQSDHFPYIPRIKYSKTYLAPATWNIKLHYFDKNDTSSTSSFRIRLQEWMKKWRIPKYIYINPTYSDQILLLNRENIIHLDQIIKILKEEKQISIYEKADLETCKWAQGNGGLHLCEFVIPIIRSNTNHFKLPNFHYSDSKGQTKVDDESWIYLKLYTSFERQNDLLINHILPLLQKINYKNWFFIRYRDSKDHLRLRVKPSQEDYYKIYHALESWSLELIQMGFISDFSFHPYWPEVERYGGINLFQKAEDLFSGDSLTVISILYLNLNEIIPIDSIAALGVIDLLLCFKFSLNESLLFLEHTFNRHAKLDGFRRCKPFLVKGIQGLIKKTPQIVSDDKILNCINSFKYRVRAVQEYQEAAIQLKDFSNEGLNTILNSFIHMYCNRLGILQEDEERVRFYAYKTISAQIMLEKNTALPLPV